MRIGNVSKNTTIIDNNDCIPYIFGDYRLHHHKCGNNLHYVLLQTFDIDRPMIFQPIAADLLF